MTLPLRISEEAAAEMVEAARWYERHRVGLGVEFLDALDVAVARMAKRQGWDRRFQGSSTWQSDAGRYVASPTMQ